MTATKAKPRTKKTLRKLTAGEKAIRWVEKHVYMFDGPDQNKPVRLADFQKEIFIEIFDNPKNPNVKVRTAILSMGRKNGKSATVAFIAIYLLMSPAAERNSLLLSAARSLDQAVEIYGYIVKSIRYSPTLRTDAQIVESKKEVYVPRLGTKFKSLAAGDPGSKTGKNPRCIFFDETGAVRGPRDRYIDALATSQGAQANPLQIHLSTQAEKDSDYFSLLIDDALAGNDPATVIKMWSAPEGADPFTEESIRAANPAWDIFQNQKFIWGEIEKAKRIPAYRNTVLNYYLNQRIAGEEKWIAQPDWKECGTPVADWHGHDVWLGIDYSKTTDLTSICIAFEPADSDRIHLSSNNWMPRDTIRERAAEDETEYDIWAKNGLLNAFPGKSIDPDNIAFFIKGIREKANIKRIAFDSWRFDEIHRSMLRMGISERWLDEVLLEFGQGTRSMDPALNKIEQYIINHKLSHGNNPLLTMAVNNVRIVTDPKDAKRKPVKGAYNKRVDPLIAAIMALKVLDDDRGIKPKRKPRFISLDA